MAVLTPLAAQRTHPPLALLAEAAPGLLADLAAVDVDSQAERVKGVEGNSDGQGDRPDGVPGSLRNPAGGQQAGTDVGILEERERGQVRHHRADEPMLRRGPVVAFLMEQDALHSERVEDAGNG